MPVTLNHTIVHATDAIATATFYADILNLPPPRRLGHFTVLQLSETSLDMIQTDQPIDPRHVFLVSEAEFDDPNGHILEDITRPYGSGGQGAQHPNPLLSA